jgi:hypothetical protein
MSAFDDDDAMTDDDTPISLDQLEAAPSDDIDLEGSDLADFNFGGEDDMPFSDEEDPD